MNRIKVTIVLSIVAVMIVAVMVKFPHKETSQNEQSERKLVYSSKASIIKLTVRALDANEFPVEITVLGAPGRHDYLMREAAYKYAMTMNTEEILKKYPDGVIRLTYYVPTMPLN